MRIATHADSHPNIGQALRARTSSSTHAPSSMHSRGRFSTRHDGDIELDDEPKSVRRGAINPNPIHFYFPSHHCAPRRCEQATQGVAPLMRACAPCHVTHAISTSPPLGPRALGRAGAPFSGLEAVPDIVDPVISRLGAA